MYMTEWVRLEVETRSRRRIGRVAAAQRSKRKEQAQSMKVKTLDHIHIYAAEPEESARFYSDHFEAKEILRNTNTNGDTRIFLALGGQVLVLGNFPKGIEPASPPEAGDGAYRHGFGVAHFGLRVEDLRAALVEIATSGVRALSQVVEEPSGLRYAYIAAPDGVVVELTQY